MRATAVNRDSLRILWLIETHPLHRLQMVDFVSVEFIFALYHHSYKIPRVYGADLVMVLLSPCAGTDRAKGS